MSGPLLDPSDAIGDVDFSGTVTVTRRAEVVTSKGVSTVPNPRTFEGVPAVVTMAAPNDLERLEDLDRGRRYISVVTNFMLRMASPGYKPDLIDHLGDRYEVVDLSPYPQFGPGWVQAIAGSINVQDQAPAIAMPDVGRLNFTDARNSALVGL